MPHLTTHLVAATITTDAEEPVGEARVWLAATAGGDWTGWLRVADFPNRPTPGRYRLTGAGGLTGEFELSPSPVSRVFETDLLPITGVGPLTLPSPAEADSPPLRLSALPNQSRL